MLVHIYDTYVLAKDGHMMHFDVITGKKDQEKAIAYANTFLKSIGHDDVSITQKECSYFTSTTCKLEREKQILEKGYCIVKMSGFQN